MTWTVTADPLRFDEAVDWFLRRTVMTAEQAQELTADLKQHAFWVGGGLQLEQVQRVFDAAANAIEQGVPFEEWRKDVKADLADPVHAETVFRNAAQRAYNAGRYAQMTDRAMLKLRPFWMYDAVLDTRTTTICKTLDSTVVAANDPWWDTHYPPLHHRCRSSVRSLLRSAAEKIGITAAPPPEPPPDGWGLSPKLAKPPKPDPKKKDPGLVGGLEAKQKTTRPRKPKSAPQHEPAFWENVYEPRYRKAAKAVAWGRAAQERGLDLKLTEVEKELRKLSKDLPHIRHGLERVTDLRRAGAKPSATLREQGGEIDPQLRSLAAIAGHLNRLPERGAAIAHPDLTAYPSGRRALAFFNAMSAEGLEHPKAWSFIRDNAQRAYASPGARKIVWNDSVGVLEHEYGHALEALNQRLADRAEAYLKARAGEDKLEKLSKLTGLAYGDQEVARKDELIDSYMGRWYEKADGSLYATELTSMGVEVLVAGSKGWGTLNQLAQNDPETFWFVLGQLGVP